jgi:hypothetical protein
LLERNNLIKLTTQNPEREKSSDKFKMKNLIDRIRTGVAILTMAGAVTTGIGGGILFPASSEGCTIKKIKAEKMVEPAYLEKLNSRIKLGESLFGYGGYSCLALGLALSIIDKKRGNYNY